LIPLIVFKDCLFPLGCDLSGIPASFLIERSAGDAVGDRVLKELTRFGDQWIFRAGVSRGRHEVSKFK